MRRGACAAHAAGDQDDVCLGFGDTGGHCADARLRHELHTHPRVRIDLLQIIDQLRKVFDRIDVMVRRRRNERHARRGVAQLRDQLCHLETRQLAAFPGLGALGDLDFYLAAFIEILSSDTKSARGNLLDGGVHIVAVRQRPVAGAVFPALTRD